MIILKPLILMGIRAESFDESAALNQDNNQSRCFRLFLLNDYTTPMVYLRQDQPYYGLLFQSTTTNEQFRNRENCRVHITILGLDFLKTRKTDEILRWEE